MLLRERDLQNSEKVSRFMQEEGFFAAEKNRAVGLEIFPKKTLSKNKLILYRLVFSRGAEKFKKNIWGKTASAKQAKLVKVLSRGSAAPHVPFYLKYLKHLKFIFSEGIQGDSLRSFEKNLTFLGKNISAVGSMLADFQNARIPPGVLGNYSRAQEQRFLEKSLSEIRNYSISAGGEFEKIARNYSEKVFSVCWNEKKFCFAHFDFQASNIFYSGEEKRFYLLDYDLAGNFNPALDAANFWVHLYVMSRYHFSRNETLRLCGKFLAGYLGKSKLKKEAKTCFGAFVQRAVIDIGKITASVFQKPSEESKAVFAKLSEIMETINKS